MADIGDVLGHFYPRPPRGGRPLQPVGLRTPDVISIHALREEGDQISVREEVIPVDFYPRPPRGGRRVTIDGAAEIQSISIHALREEGDLLRCGCLYCRV